MLFLIPDTWFLILRFVGEKSIQNCSAKIVRKYYDRLLWCDIIHAGQLTEWFLSLYWALPSGGHQWSTHSYDNACSTVSRPEIPDTLYIYQRLWRKHTSWNNTCKKVILKCKFKKQHGRGRRMIQPPQAAVHKGSAKRGGGVCSTKFKFLSEMRGK
jgi:hypothetical protein